MRSLKITPGGSVRGDIKVPGDKSISHRAVMFGAIADGVSRVSGFLTGEDSVNTARAFAKMGVEIEGLGGAELVIHGAGLDGLIPPADALDLGNSGTSMRLLTGLLAGQGFGCSLDGDEYLRRRPMKRVITPLTTMGARIDGQGEKGYPPLFIHPTGRGEMKAIDYVSPIASAQVKSAVLLAGLYADGTTSVTEPAKSRDHTERMLRFMGVDVIEDGLKVGVAGGQRLTARDFMVPGDLSSAAFFMVAAAITPGSELTIRGVGVNPTRTGIIDALKAMGADIELFNINNDGPEPVADIRVKSSALKGIEVGGELFVRSIDEFPILCVAAACANGATVVKDAAELRVKESDRIAAMARELLKAGVAVTETPDGLIIEGGRAIRAADVDSHGDHRVAMSMAVAGLVAIGGDMRVADTGCVDTSFPGFEKLLERVRA